MGGMGRGEAERLVEHVHDNVIDEGVRDMHHLVAVAVIPADIA